MTSSPSQQNRFAQDSYEDNNYDVDDGFERRHDVGNDVTRRTRVRRPREVTLEYMFSSFIDTLLLLQFADQELERTHEVDVSDGLHTIAEHEFDPNMTVARKNWVKAITRVSEQLDRVSRAPLPVLMSRELT